MQKKIEELNQKIISNGQKDLSLNPTELSVLQSIRKHLESVGVTKSSQDIPGGLDLAIKLVTVWPYPDRLPGLDLLRLLAVAPATATYAHPRYGNIISIVTTSISENAPPAENNIMMGIRAFGNLFETAEGRTLALAEFNTIQAFTTNSLSTGSKNRNLLVAAMTLYINYAVLFTSGGSASSFEHTLALFDSLAKTLTTQTDSEVVYRALVATGTLLGLGEEEQSAAKEIYGIEDAVKAAVGKASDPRIRNVAGEIRGLMG